ncbi:alpha-L-arabinofuranosidase C-terminal domain-containing protein [Opitutus sp. ER46]|uniref:alpha-L-arabinofuranosidase C-terminal domain-containing protein n=1 Tax=Opitutus sp. ER46 TaxID=2161864 RepID=UPI000D327CE1|nr:alpha-L-arabinofuranosidase C-terminal domain-containing protein [Opitutus sp. ER46]PTX91418.1 alpha-L-arabinofuranosidase [Opitutus sp. ER46]
MRLRPFVLHAFVATLAAASFAAPAIPVRITIDAAARGHAVSPMLHGLFFEDINYAADGGLYAELVQNRSFEHDEALFSWGTVSRGADGQVTIETAQPLNERNPHYARLAVRAPGRGFGLANYGFGGLPVAAGETYFVSLRARGQLAAPTPGPATAQPALQVILEDETGRRLGACALATPTTEWSKLEGTFKASGPATNGRLVVLVNAPGQVDVDVVSLFPEKTFHGRRNGVRADLGQMLADLKPAFLRFPGGCIVEGKDLANRYQWKDTIGDIAERRQNWSRWRDAIRNQTAPQYYQTYGLGFFEYFQLCEDLGAEPVPVLSCGMACQYQSGELVPLDQLDPYVQDALDLVEFANGPVTSTWGAKRAAMGHPAPFNLKYLGVGNEQWGEQYFPRYRAFHDALKARYPDLHIVTTAGPGVDDGSWKLAWDRFRSDTPADIVDEHYYRPPQWFLENASRYDAQPRPGPKVFAGEFAAHERDRRATLRAAVAEAAFMTGLLRNSDVVVMSAYAPLFARAGAIQWQPDLIWFDNTRVHATGSYHVQRLFSRNRPDVLVGLQIAGEPIRLTPLPAKEISTYGAAPLPPYHPASVPTVFAVAGIDRTAGELVVFLVNPFAEPRAATLDLRGVNGTNGRAVVLTSASADDTNTFAEPTRIAPREESFTRGTGPLVRELAPQSVTVLRLGL